MHQQINTHNLKTTTIMETTQIKKSNSLIYKCDKIVGKNHYFATVRLNDECKNGHQDFSITGDIYEAGKPKTDKYFISGGAIGDKLALIFPELEIFERLHLCDYSGAPMHAVANMHYHLKNGFSKMPIESPKFKDEFCKYYRITREQFDVLNKSFSKIHFAILLQGLDIPHQWNKEAKEAIKLLENLTGCEFLNDSKRSQLIMPSAEEISEEKERIKNGYYSKEAQQEREKQAFNGILQGLQDEFHKEVEKHRIEFEVKKAVLIAGGKKTLDNVIFYNHSQTLTFNWRDYDNLSIEFIEEVKSKLNLPKGIKITIGK